jgi:hypothetical protein
MDELEQWKASYAALAEEATGLKAERDRLRKALEEIALLEYDSGLASAIHIAHAALAALEEKKS